MPSPEIRASLICIHMIYAYPFLYVNSKFKAEFLVYPKAQKITSAALLWTCY